MKPSSRPPAKLFTRELLIGLGDSSVRKTYYSQLQAQRLDTERFRMLLDQTRDAIFLVDLPTGNIVDANVAARSCANSEPAAIIGTPINHWLTLPVSFSHWEQVFEELTGSVQETWLHSGTATPPLPVEISCATVAIDNGLYAVIVARDITRRKQREQDLNQVQITLKNNLTELEALYSQLSATEEALRQKIDELEDNRQALAESETRYRLAMEGSHDAIWDWDLRRNKWTVSQHWQDKFQLPSAAADGYVSEWERRIHPDDLTRRNQALLEHLSGQTPFYNCEFRAWSAPDTWVWVHSQGKALFDEHKLPIRMSGSYSDITSRKEQEKYMHYMAYHDQLTSLPNGFQLKDYLTKLLQAPPQEPASSTIFLLDMDNFKLINASWGNSLGDTLLVEFAQRLQDFMPADAFIARIGGDEFCMVLPALPEAEIALWANHILTLMEKPFVIRSNEFSLSCSLGVAMSLHARTPEELLRNANTALYRAKAAGRKTWRLFTQDMQADIMNRIRIENDLHKALASQQFSLSYQPQVCLLTGRVTSFEALLRWQHPEQGFISPQDFIPIAEETRLILPLGEWVLRKACRFAKEFAQHNQPMRVAVNVSACQLMHPNYAIRVKEILAEEDFPPFLLELEITESILMQSFDYAVQQLTLLKRLGLRIALDDFGTGYSSLTYLSQLPIDTLKIDKSFLQTSSGSRPATAIIQTMIELAHKLQMTVVAEGVETIEQFSFLQKTGCDSVQGYLFSRPLPHADALRCREAYFIDE